MVGQSASTPTLQTGATRPQTRRYTCIRLVQGQKRHSWSGSTFYVIATPTDYRPQDPTKRTPHHDVAVVVPSGTPLYREAERLFLQTPSNRRMSSSNSSIVGQATTRRTRPISWRNSLSATPVESLLFPLGQDRPLLPSRSPWYKGGKLNPAEIESPASVLDLPLEWRPIVTVNERDTGDALRHNVTVSYRDFGQVAHRIYFRARSWERASVTPLPARITRAANLRG